MFLYVIDTKSRRARDNRIIFFSGNLNTAVVFQLATQTNEGDRDNLRIFLFWEP